MAISRKANKKSPDTLTDHFNPERLAFLIDGVFAITLTLLVLELRPPETDRVHLAEGLLGLLPRLAVYLIAFYTIANHWVIHQRTFRHITNLDTTGLWLNLLSLLFITLMPASTAIVGRFPTEGLALACFSVNSLMHAVTNWLFWHYVMEKRERFTDRTNPQLLGITSRVWLFICMGWLASLLLGFVNIYATYVSWVLWPNLVANWGNHRRQLLLQS